MTLIEALQQIPDHRRGAGQRYRLWVFLLLVILGTMSGYRGYQGLARFMRRHQGIWPSNSGCPEPSCRAIQRFAAY